MFIVNFATGPIKALFNVQQAFEKLDHKELDLTMQKLMYLGANCAVLGLTLYKFSNMGIIPVQPVDWAGLYPANYAIERS